MREFEIRITSVRDVEEFVALATSRPFTVILKDSHHQINGKSFMEMFCLDLSRPLTVAANCSEEAFQQFLRDADRFLVK